MSNSTKRSAVNSNLHKNWEALCCARLMVCQCSKPAMKEARTMSLSVIAGSFWCTREAGQERTAGKAACRVIATCSTNECKHGSLFFFVCFFLLCVLQGPKGLPGALGPPGLPGIKVRLCHMTSPPGSHNQPATRSHDQSMRSHDWPLRSHDWSMRSHDQSMRSHDWPLRSHDQSMRAHDQSMRAHDQSMRSHDWPSRSHEF